MPFGVIYAWRFSRLYPTQEEFEENLDKLLAYMGRYGKQDMTALQHETTVQLRKWAKQIDKLIDEERQAAESARS